MNVLSPLTELIFRSILVLLPLTVGWLAFRRLALSKSGNAWIYAVTCLLSSVTVAGTLPWALGLTQTSWVFLALALLSPALWLGVVLLCDSGRRHEYGPDPVVSGFFPSLGRPGPLLLENPEEVPAPVFRHSTPAPAVPDRPEPKSSPKPHSVISIAREIRNNRTSERRRPKLLPPPDDRDLPFLRKSRLR